MELLTHKELMALIRCSAATVYRRLCERRAGLSSFPLPVTEEGKKRLWKRQDVENWLDSPKNAKPISTSKRQPKTMHRSGKFRKKRRNFKGKGGE